MEAFIKVDEQGNLVIPKAIISSQAFAPNFEFRLIRIADGFILKASLNEEERKILADFDAKIQSQLDDLTDRACVFGTLTADAYLNLSEPERERLWDSAVDEAYQTLKETVELEVPNDYRPARQRRDNECAVPSPLFERREPS